LIFGPWANTEFYVQGGFSYHTNDVRGSTQLYEPVSPDYPYYNTPNPIKIPFLVQDQGRGSRRAHLGRPTTAKHR
jgi:hypothetical protein